MSKTIRKTIQKAVSLLLLFLPVMSFASIDEVIEENFAPISHVVTQIVFYPVTIGPKEVPIVLLILLGGAFFFTLYFKFANIRLLKVAIKATKGDYDEVDHAFEEGDDIETIKDKAHTDKERKTTPVIGVVTHFQALTAALSATVGLGNIAGVAVAMALGGPGAIIWMMLAGFLGMSTKLVEATLGVKYREVSPEGNIYGGPMYYLRKGLKEKNMARLGKVLATMYAIFVVGGSLGGGNMFQANQATSQFMSLTGMKSGFGFGIVLAILVGIVIIGGIKRIGQVTEKIVPFMGILFVGASLIILGKNYDMIPGAALQIWDGAFGDNAMLGGFVGVMIVGFQRAAFSNEAGVGSASIAHAAVKTKFPASEGIVASIGPFVDTVIICSMTALVIVITNLKYDLFRYANLDGSNVIMNGTGEKVGGVDLTSAAFDSSIPHFSIVLTIAVILFAFSTMLSWSYYGIQGWSYLFGKGKVADITYKILFLFVIVVGASSSLNSVVEFSDSMIFAMVFPNIVGLVLLAPKVKQEIKRYLTAIKHKVES